MATVRLDLDVASIIERVAGKRVLVVGSLPPGGRDWDLLVDPSDSDRLQMRLRQEGFERVRDSWVRPGDDRPEVVEVRGASDWRLSDSEAEAMFRQAVPLGGHVQLCVPAPEHRLQILARKLPRTPGLLEPKQRERVREALRDAPDAFARAGSQAAKWGMKRRLRRLEGRYRRPYRESVLTRLIRKPRRGAVIAFSGLDGAGKSTQAKALSASLQALGYDTTLIWTPIGHSQSLRRFASALKRTLSRLPVGPLAGAEGDVVEKHLLSQTGPGSPAPRSLRRIGAGVWSTVTTTANALAYRRGARGTRIGGRIAIFDRYVLDTVVELRFLYAPRGRMRLQEALVRTLAPAPRCTYLLDLVPEIAHARKPDWSLEQTRLRAGLYSDQTSSAGVRRLDAGRPANDLSLEILLDALRSLPR